MHDLLTRTVRVVLGLLICIIGSMGAIVLIVVTIQNAGAWIFLVAPVSIIVAILLLRLGTRLIATT